MSDNTSNTTTDNNDSTSPVRGQPTDAPTTGDDKKPFTPPPLKGEALENALNRRRGGSVGGSEQESPTQQQQPEKKPINLDEDEENAAAAAAAPAADAAPAAPEETEEEKAARLAAEAAAAEKHAKEELAAQQRSDRDLLERNEFELRDQLEDSEAAEFASGVVAQERADRGVIVQAIRAEAARIRCAAGQRREASQRLVTALSEVRQHLAPQQERVNTTKEYANIAIKCRHFAAWLDETFLSKEKLNPHYRTDGVSVEELERLHAERDALLDELEQLADNMAALREHIVLDEGDLSHEQAEKMAMEESRMYTSMNFGDDSGTDRGTATIDGHTPRRANNNNTASAAAASAAHATVGGASTQQQQHHVDAQSFFTDVEKTSAHSRAQEALRNEKNLLAKLRELEEEKRRLDMFLIHREKDSVARCKAYEQQARAADAGMAGVNKELCRLEAAVDAHWRVLRTTYSSFKGEFAALFEFDAFTNPNSKVGGSSTSNGSSRALITDGSSQQIESHSATVQDSPAATDPSAAAAPAASSGPSLEPYVAPSFLGTSYRSNAPLVGTHRSTAALARDAARLTSDAQLDRVHQAAALHHVEVSRKGRTKFDEVADMKEDLSARREAAKNAELRSPKAYVHYKKAEEAKKMVSPVQFKRL